jgi:hypothetical protein
MVTPSTSVWVTCPIRVSVPFRQRLWILNLPLDARGAAASYQRAGPAELFRASFHHLIHRLPLGPRDAAFLAATVLTVDFLAADFLAILAVDFLAVLAVDFLAVDF